MKIVGVMIVKNEEHVIERCLKSAAKIANTFVIVDTGSTDKTYEKIVKIMDELNLEIITYQKPWVNFGHNRSEALKLAKGQGDYALIIDADDEFEGTIKSELTADAYSISVKSGVTTFNQTRLMKLDMPWRYVGCVHEYPTCENVKAWPYLPDIKINTNNDGNSWKDPNKYKTYALLLWKEHLDDPTNARTVFYLAQSFRDCADYEEAERWYKKRIEMGGWMGEIWYSQFYLGKLEHSRGNIANAVKWFLDAYNTDTRRVETLYELMKMYHILKQYNTAYLFGIEALAKPIPDDALFPIPSNYGIDLYEELGLCAFYSNHFEVAKNAWEKILSMDISDATKERILKNISFIPN